METRNLTVRLDRETIRSARILAAQQGTSISRLVARTIAQLVEQEQAYTGARERALAILDRGLRLGGRIRATREQLHER